MNWRTQAEAPQQPVIPLRRFPGGNGNSSFRVNHCVETLSRRCGVTSNLRLRIPDFGFPTSLFILALALSCSTAFAQPRNEPALAPTLSPEEASQTGQALAADLRAQKPEANSTISGVLKVRESGKDWREVPVQFQVLVTSTNWRNTYETTGSQAPRVKLTVVHADGQPNKYRLCKPPGPSATNAVSQTLTSDQTMAPFAGSDFWLADLGLEFLHWPQQRLVSKGISRGRACHVLESVNPQPVPGGYARVVSSIDLESGGIIHAEAFDAAKKLLKEFDPKGFTKVNGQWQLDEMLIRNCQTGSRTRIEFNVTPEKK
jgi:hypothetical protein